MTSFLGYTLEVWMAVRDFLSEVYPGHPLEAVQRARRRMSGSDSVLVELERAAEEAGEREANARKLRLILAKRDAEIHRLKLALDRKGVGDITVRDCEQVAISTQTGDVITFQKTLPNGMIRTNRARFD